MSDEFRDLLKHRAGEVSVPAGDLDDVIHGGNARKWRNRMYSVSVLILVAVVGWATVPGFLDSMRDEGRAPNIADTPTPGPTPTEAAGACETVPFRPMYLPDGWSYVLRPGTGLQPGIPLDEQTPRGIGYYMPLDGKGKGTHFNVMNYGSYYTLPEGDGTSIEVLGEEGLIGQVEDGNTVEFTYDGCKYSLMAFGIPSGELHRIARNLRPLSMCVPQAVSDGRVMNLGNGRFFGYIRAINEGAVEFDVAEFLTGAEATAAAIEAGDIEPGETVPSDYYIANPDKETGPLELSDDVTVFIETLQDSMIGLAPADVPWLICAFSGQQRKDDVLHWVSPYWLTVRNGRVVEIEEQYLP